jgi:hypothetical protein
LLAMEIQWISSWATICSRWCYPLKDRNNNPLFTPELTLITSGKTLETAGIRGVKYIQIVET